MDETYLKMILALPDEFFKDCEWKPGDKAINILNNREIVILWVTHPDIWIKERYAAYYSYQPSFSNEVFTKIKLCDIRPIPSQEQLQKICINFHVNHNKMSEKRAILHIMGHWADVLKTKHDFEYQKVEDRFDYEYFGDPESFDILMLKFTVSTILMLSWDGEKWL